MENSSDNSSSGGVRAEVVDCKDIIPNSSELSEENNESSDARSTQSTPTKPARKVADEKDDYTKDQNFFDFSPVKSAQSTPRKTRGKQKRTYKEYWCSHCGKHFKHKGNMQQHERTHTQERPFICTVCGLSFKKSSALLEHRRRHKGIAQATTVGSGKIHGCAICNRSFLSKNSLDVHLRTHSDECSFSCKECGKKFKHRSSLQRHLLTHSGIKNYECDYCQKRFYDSSDMKKHLAIHTGYKKYKCFACGKQFVQSSSLNSHFKSHISHINPENFKDESFNRKNQSGLNGNEIFENSSFESGENSEDESIESLDEDEILNIARNLEDKCIKNGDDTEKNELKQHSREINGITEYNSKKSLIDDDGKKSNYLETPVRLRVNENETFLSCNKESLTEYQKKTIVARNRLKSILDHYVKKPIASSKPEHTFVNNVKSFNEKVISGCHDERDEIVENGYMNENKSSNESENLSSNIYVENANDITDAVGVQESSDMVANDNLKESELEVKVPNVSTEREVIDANGNVKSCSSTCKSIGITPNDCINDSKGSHKSKDFSQEKGVIDSRDIINTTVCNKKGSTVIANDNMENLTARDIVKNISTENELANANEMMPNCAKQSSEDCKTDSALKHTYVEMEGKDSNDNMNFAFDNERKVSSVSVNVPVRTEMIELDDPVYTDKKNDVEESKINAVSVYVPVEVDSVDTMKSFSARSETCNETQTKEHCYSEIILQTDIEHEEQASVQTDVIEKPNDGKVVEESGAMKSKISQNGVQEQIQGKKTKTKECRHCGMLFEERTVFVQHLQEHWRAKRFVCEDCKQTFVKWRYYSRHKCRKIKGSVTDYKKNDVTCAYCDKNCGNETSLKLHVKAASRACKDCGKIICTLKERKKHEMMHHSDEYQKKTNVHVNILKKHEAVFVHNKEHGTNELLQTSTDKSDKDGFIKIKNVTTSHDLQNCENPGFSDRDEKINKNVACFSNVPETGNVIDVTKDTKSMYSVKRLPPSNGLNICSLRTQEKKYQTISGIMENDSETSECENDENTEGLSGTENTDIDEIGYKCKTKHDNDETFLSTGSKNLVKEKPIVRKYAGSGTQDYSGRLIISNKLFQKRNKQLKSKCKQNLVFERKFKRRNVITNFDRSEKTENTIDERKKDVIKTVCVQLLERAEQIKCKPSFEKHQNGAGQKLAHLGNAGRSKDQKEQESVICDEDTSERAKVVGKDCDQNMSYLVYNDQKNEKCEQKFSSSDSESEYLEDDEDDSYVEEIVISKDLGTKKSDGNKFGNPNRSFDNEYHEKIISRQGVSRESSKATRDNTGCNTKRYSENRKNTGSAYLKKGRYELRNSKKSKVKFKIEEVTSNKEVTISDESSDSATDEDSEGYEECTAEEVQAMLDDF